MTTPWKYTSGKQDAVTRTFDDGRIESCIADRDDVRAWVQAGNTILPADPLPEPEAPTKQDLQAQLADIQAQIDALPDDSAQGGTNA